MLNSKAKIREIVHKNKLCYLIAKRKNKRNHLCILYVNQTISTRNRGAS